MTSYLAFSGFTLLAVCGIAMSADIYFSHPPYTIVTAPTELRLSLFSVIVGAAGSAYTYLTSTLQV